VSSAKAPLTRKTAAFLVLGALLPATTSARPAPTRRFEVRADRAWLGGHEIRLWGIRSGNGLMSPAVTERFVRNLDNMAAHGLNAIAVYLMGSNTGWPEERGARNGFEPDGRLKPAFAERLEWLVREADGRGMVVGVGIFTPRNVENLAGEEAYRRALQETGRFLVARGLRNVFVDIMHEYGHRRVVPEIFREPGGAEKKARLTRWFKEAAPEVPAGVCATIDLSQPGYPGADVLILQKTMPIPGRGYAINIESHKRDNYDDEGVFDDEGRAEMYGWFEQYRRAPNAGFFFHAAFVQGVTGRDGTGPHAEMGGHGRGSGDRGIRFYYEWVRDHVGRWEYPRHVRAPAAGSGR
jgi:hypothetical protein